VKGPAFLWYTILRLLLIAVPLAILLALRVGFVVSAFAATFIGLCLSYILLAKLRHQVAGSLYERLHRAKPARSEDDDAEDAAVDAALSTDGPQKQDVPPVTPEAVTPETGAGSATPTAKPAAADPTTTEPAADDGAGSRGTLKDHAERDA
jgi:hypothetical protein